MLRQTLTEDIVIARHFRAAVLGWPLFAEGRISLAHFYDPGLPMKREQPAEHYTRAQVPGNFFEGNFS